ncbi:hypothetical protein MUK42_22251 [Musa troglodytarum]|uniref:Alpha N-terminal protein methyltransferase 1 n=1 Tax=Musa troglodytarum TaxID=320322 RepID=A0A9E7G697_9LILI|nr:hypothetical protein MUK42_22251 [Musa troglodytarum]
MSPGQARASGLEPRRTLGKLPREADIDGQCPQELRAPGGCTARPCSRRTGTAAAPATVRQAATSASSGGTEPMPVFPQPDSPGFHHYSTAHFGCLLECLMSAKGSIGFDTGFVLDKEDNSITRSDSYFKDLFKQCGLHLYRTKDQMGFPEELFPVKMYALVTDKRQEHHGCRLYLLTMICDNTKEGLRNIGNSSPDDDTTYSILVGFYNASSSRVNHFCYLPALLKAGTVIVLL